MGISNGTYTNMYNRNCNHSNNINRMWQCGDPLSPQYHT